MSISAVEHVRKIAGLKTSEKFVLTTIAHYLNSKSNLAWPSIPTLASDCALTERSVLRALASLEAKKHIKRLRSQTNQRNIYQLPGFEPENLRSSPHDTVAPRQNVTPDRNDTPPLTECHPTPDRNDTPNKEERELNLNRTREPQALALSKKANVNPPSPQVPQVYTPPQVPEFDWNRYAQRIYSLNGRQRNQPRMTAGVERILNSVASYSKCVGPQAAAKYAEESFSSLPASWQAYLRSQVGELTA